VTTKEFTASGDITASGNITTHGNITISGAGDLILGGADCAEQFDASDSEAIEPGTVLVIDANGALRKCHSAYDHKVAGVVSGAGDFKSGILLDRRPGQEGRTTVALIGKVYRKVDGSFGPINVGDLLTTSITLGHAMKVSDSRKAFGAVIGKALNSLSSGKGLIPILVALQ
jgi:hypothetical protein